MSSITNHHVSKGFLQVLTGFRKMADRQISREHWISTTENLTKQENAQKLEENNLKKQDKGSKKNNEDVKIDRLSKDRQSACTAKLD